MQRIEGVMADRLPASEERAHEGASRHAREPDPALPGRVAPSSAFAALRRLQGRAGNAAVAQMLRGDGARLGALRSSAGQPASGPSGDVRLGAPGGAVTVQRKGLRRAKGGGYKAYEEPKLSVKLREMRDAGTLVHQGKPIALSDSDMFLLQSVANVESAGKTAAVNTWDNMIVSMGFKQVVLVHGSLYEVIRMAPAAFKSHGIVIGAGEYDLKLRNQKIKRPRIEGADDPQELRTEPWAKRFLEAGLDDRIISALVVYALEDERELYGKVEKKTPLTHEFMSDPTVRAWLFQAYNNRPAFAVKAARATLAKTAGKDLTRDQFLDIVAAAIRAAYRERPDKPERGGNEEWKAKNIIRKIPRSGHLETEGEPREQPLPKALDDATESTATSTAETGTSAEAGEAREAGEAGKVGEAGEAGEAGESGLGELTQLFGFGASAINAMTSMLGLPDLRTLLAGQGIDASSLTNVVFFLRHPEMGGRPIAKGERALAKEWIEIRDGIVAPLLERLGHQVGGDRGGDVEVEPASGDVDVEPDSGDTTTRAEDADGGGATATEEPGASRDLVHDAMRSTIELLPEEQRERFQGIEWGWLDYPGRKSKPGKKMSADELAAYKRDESLVLVSGGAYFVGKHQKDADALFLALAAARPGGGERRANLGGAAVLTEGQFRKNQTAHDDHIQDQLAHLKGQDPTRSKMMNKHAAEKFGQLYDAAASEGVAIEVRNAFRGRARAEAAAKKSGNAKAVAFFSPHSLGLAMDLNLWASSMAETGDRWTETSTGDFTNIVRMMASPAYKFMYLHGADYGFYQYRREPWHWEFNPPGFKKTFFEDQPSLSP